MKSQKNVERMACSNAAAEGGGPGADDTQDTTLLTLKNTVKYEHVLVQSANQHAVESAKIGYSGFGNRTLRFSRGRRR